MRNFRGLLLVLALGFLALLAPRAEAQVAVSVTVAPPPLPVYVQPPLPGPGWMWTPGYWAWGAYGYYWVPGTWVRPPRVGLLWTPGYWGWARGAYIWHAGYWGPHIGFYGGVNYGFGYIGAGYFGGFWDHGAFHYNAVVNNVRNVHVTVYRQTTVNNINITRSVTRVSYNGGRDGLTARPTPREEAAAREPHVAATNLQHRHETMALGNRGLRASVNHGRPAIAATARPAAFAGHGVVRAQGAQPYRPRPQGQHAHPQGQRVRAAAAQHGPGPAQRGNQHPQHPGEAHDHDHEGHHSPQ